jgi:hypothetical protein
LYEGAVKMISHQQKSGKQTGTDKLRNGYTKAPTKKVNQVTGIRMTVDPELDKFSGDEFVPEKHKEAEIRLANSNLPPFK